ncbi:hypothetical protein [Natrinema marinum]|uniref:hypothetical protein n=1 Tax=Natrinema marinum TaxID=2961598 RepID=UPI0020C92BD2|nr:hypothetical protein [Natrinema marinum]
MSHQYQHQPQQGQPTEQYGQQPTQSMGGQRPVSGGQQPIPSGQQRTQGIGGQQMRPQGTAGGRGPGGQQMQHRQSFEGHLTNELRIALEDFTELSNVADWCATECASEGRQLATCARICHDIAELADLNESLIARDSMFGPEVADAFVRVATEGLAELQQYQQHPHIAETISVIDRTIDSCSIVLGMVDGQAAGGQQPGSQPIGGQQPMTGNQPQQQPMTSSQPQRMSGRQQPTQGMTGGRGTGGQR